MAHVDYYADVVSKTLTMRGFTRADFLKLTMAAGAAAALGATGGSMAATGSMQTRPIPKSGERLPVIGLGTWQGFDIGDDPDDRAVREKVLDLLFESGGSMIDSSPMYGRAEAVVGDLLSKMQARNRAFLATKVWTWGEDTAIDQMNESFRLLQTDVIDLMQIHNLVDWKTHLRTLQNWKEAGRLRYIGVTHYTEAALKDLGIVMRTEDIDFVRLPYSIGERRAENEILPLAADKGIAVIANRPFQGGMLFRTHDADPLPAVAREIGIESWGQLFLKYVLADPAVTCAIPGTSNPRHITDSLVAGSGPMLEPDARKALIHEMLGD